jgi:hypothetical protein
MMTGTYGNETISADKGAANVVFFEASGQTVQVTTQLTADSAYSLDFACGAGDMEFRDMEIRGPRIGFCQNGTKVNDLTFTRIDSNILSVICASNILYDNGDLGPDPASSRHPSIQVYDLGGPSGQCAPDHITIQDSYLHDFTNPTDINNHTECLQVNAGDVIKVLRNRFYNCWSTAAIGSGGGANWSLTNFTVENNMFLSEQDQTQRPCYLFNPNRCPVTDVQGDLCGGLSFKNNTFYTGIYFNIVFTCTVGDGDQNYIVGNFGEADPGNVCGANVTTYDKNVWQGGFGGDNDGCGSPGTDYVMGSGNTIFTGCSGFCIVSASDFHLASGSVAIDKGGTSFYPADDFDKQLRYLGTASDAGADEKS